MRSRFNKTLSVITVFIVLILVQTLSGQQLSKDSLQLEEVVITGTKTSVSRNSVPLTISVITEAQIEESSESALLPVLSEQVPGVFLTERGVSGFGVSTGAAGAINIRGIGGSPNTQTLILLNGNPQFMGIMGHPLPDTYIASDVERVEIIRGPASTLYGSNAMGGVINIISKKQKEDGLKANARLIYGSYNTLKYMLNCGVKQENFSAFVSFNHDQTDGHRDSSEFSINNGHINLGYALNNHIRLNTDFSLANFDATDPGMENANAGETIDITRGIGAITIDNRYDRINGSARFFYNFGEHSITDGFHSRDKNLGFIIYQSMHLFKGSTFTLGTDYKIYGGIAENVLSMNNEGIVFGDTTVREFASYIYISQTFFNKLIADAGFRIEYNNVFGFEPVPTFGLIYHLSSTTLIKTSVSKGFRSPTIRELYLWGTANTGLEPERMINSEIGLIQKLYKNKITFELTGYRATGENLIKLVADSGSMRYQNTGSFSNLGLELSGSYKPIEQFSLNLNYSLISMKTPILATPCQQLYLSGAYKWNKFLINISVQYIDKLYTQLSPTLETQSYALLNSKVAYKITRYVDIFLKGENLTNKKYYINYAYPMPGLVVFAGLNLHF